MFFIFQGQVFSEHFVSFVIQNGPFVFGEVGSLEISEEEGFFQIGFYLEACDDLVEGVLDFFIFIGRDRRTDSEFFHAAGNHFGETIDHA